MTLTIATRILLTGIKDYQLANARSLEHDQKSHEALTELV